MGWNDRGITQRCEYLEHEYIVACQAHPALVKIGLILARLFYFNSFLVRFHLVKVLRTACVCYKHLFHLCTD